MPANDDDILHMVMTDCGGGLLEARLLELDLAVSGASEAELLDELRYAIIANHEVAVERGLTPFANLYRERSEYRGEIESNHFDEIGVLDLPQEVSKALAIALHQPRPTRLHVKGLKLAA